MFSPGRILQRFISNLGDQEIVVLVEHEDDGTDTVTTRLDGARYVYRGVRRGAVCTGDALQKSLPHRTRTVRLSWSPWDGADND